MLEAAVSNDGRYVRAELDERGRLDRVRRDDLRRGRALRAAVQGDQEERGRRRVLPLRLPYPPNRQHASYTILVCICDRQFVECHSFSVPFMLYLIIPLLYIVLVLLIIL